jgi:hypothetical protein
MTILRVICVTVLKHGCSAISDIRIGGGAPVRPLAGLTQSIFGKMKRERLVPCQ